MESHSADRAQLRDEVGDYLLRLTPSHYEVAVTNINTHARTHVQKLTTYQTSCILGRELVIDPPGPEKKMGIMCAALILM